MIILAEYSLTRIFRQPLPIWNYWYLLLFPLCLAVAIVYKAIKCRTMAEVPRQALGIMVWILLSFGAGAVALALLVRFVDR